VTCLSILGAVVFLTDVGGADEPPVRNNDVKVVRNIAYYEGQDADPVRHRLDIYVPKGKKDFPVVFFVHGGAWMHGDKNHFGIYAQLARCLAQHGIGMVSTNYRLSPKVKHPEHIRDVARAFAWTYGNIEKYGGRPDELFVAGHSAGGHLAALLATDERYLKEQRLTLAAIRGAMPVSGVYTIPDQQIFHKIFGKDQATLRDASPVVHVCAAAPPFLIIYGDDELPGCDGRQAEEFCKALDGKRCPAITFQAVRRNHVSILVNAIHDTDPVMQHLLGFVASQVTLHRLAAGGPEGVDFLTVMLGRAAGNQNGNAKVKPKNTP
jgi:acetyl esterase/lipase